MLVDPKLEIHTSVNYPAPGTDLVVGQNDNWGDEPGAAGAFVLPSGSTDAAIATTLPAGAYTALATGANGTTGQALIEVYESP